MGTRRFEKYFVMNYLCTKRRLIKKYLTMKTRISWIFYCLVSFMLLPSLSAAERFVTNESNGFTWIQQGKAYPILVDLQEDKGVLRAVANLQTDAGKVTGATPEIIHSPSGNRMLIIGSVENSSWIKQLLFIFPLPYINFPADHSNCHPHKFFISLEIAFQ